jgi:hypothetical protein
MDLLDRQITCPYCGETIDILLDDSVEQQDYYEDCSVCCRPIHVSISTDVDGDVMLDIKRDDEC